jgi:methylase of polypeptide subunit release factors
MASSSLGKPVEESGIYVHGQDSAIHLEDAAESSTANQQQPHPAPQDPEQTTDDHDASEFESDSAFDSGSLLEDETATLASSILNHRIENGRQYHAYRDGAYWGPNDELAKEILDFAHHMYLLTMDQKLHLAPLHHPQTILDVGTGTGIWAIVSPLSCPHPQSIPAYVLIRRRTWQTNTPPLP